MSARGMVRATERGFVCCDCGQLLEQDEALVCAACDRADLEALRALLAPERPQTVAEYMKRWSAELRRRVGEGICPSRRDS